jgi:hypothetical protein
MDLMTEPESFFLFWNFQAIFELASVLMVIHMGMDRANRGDYKL